MKVVFFDFTINFGGAPQGSVYLAQRLSEYFDVHIIDAFGGCDDYHSAIRKLKIPLHILHPNHRKAYIGNSGQPLKRAVSLIRSIPEMAIVRKRFSEHVGDINPSAIWVNNEKSLAVTASVKKISKIPKILYYRGWGTKDQISDRFIWMLKHVVSKVIVHSKATYNQFVNIGLPKSKVIYTPNAVDHFTVLQMSKSDCEPKLPGNQSQLKILLPAARPVKEKGHLAAVKTLYRIRQSGIDAVLWFPGKTATGHNSNFIEQLEYAVKELDLENYVHFIGWRNDMPAVINASDIVILPTHTEGFPRVLLEAMLLKKPVCATPVGGIPEIVIHRRTGLLFPVDDDLALSKALIELSADSILISSVIKNAYDNVIKNYIANRNTELVKNVFLNLKRPLFDNGV